MADAFILSAARTPIGKYLGALADVPAVELGATAAAAALQRAGVPAERVDEHGLRHRDHAEACRTSELTAIGQSEMLDAMPNGTATERFVDTEHLIDGHIADRMRGDPPAGRVRLSRQRAELAGIEPQHAPRIGVAIRHAQCRRGSTQAAVEIGRAHV